MVTTRANFKKTQNIPITLVTSNDDLLTEILVRLPAKSIIRFKSVSKHWRSLLSHRHFTLRFDNLSISPGLFFKDLYIPFDIENQSARPFCRLSFCCDPYGIEIVQSCNGLLLCCSRTYTSSPFRKYYVFNPTTKQFVVIPPVKGGLDVRENISSMGMAFHQTDCVHYKLVCIYRVPNPDRPSHKIQIYSSDTGKWRILRESFHVSKHMSYCKYVVYWNGALHWACRHDPFYFKLDVEHLQNLPLQNFQYSMTSYFSPLYFGESRGYLHFVDTTHHKDPLHLNVYEMLSNHSGWFLKYHVELDELPAAYPEMILGYTEEATPHFCDLKILHVVRGEKEEDTFMVVKIPNKIIRYNILNKSFKVIFDLPGILQPQEVAHCYIETIGSF